MYKRASDKSKNGCILFLVLLLDDQVAAPFQGSMSLAAKRWVRFGNFKSTLQTNTILISDMCKNSILVSKKHTNCF